MTHSHLCVSFLKNFHFCRSDERSFLKSLVVLGVHADRVLVGLCGVALLKGGFTDGKQIDAWEIAIIDWGMLMTAEPRAKKFRDYPSLTRRSGIRLWPPAWSNAYRDKKSWPVGEIGTLEKAWMHELLDRCVFLYRT